MKKKYGFFPGKEAAAFKAMGVDRKDGIPTRAPALYQVVRDPEFNHRLRLRSALSAVARGFAHFSPLATGAIVRCPRLP